MSRWRTGDRATLPTRPLLAVLALFVAALAPVASGCLTDAQKSSALAFCPPIKDFRPVSSVLERRCGTLDCHGTPERPLRIYGQSGLRRPETKDTLKVDDFDEYITGGEVATTDAEIEDNYEAVCGLEPELMDRVARHEGAVDELSVVRKPRLTEKHKGGRIWAAGSTQGDACLTSWILGSLNNDSCRTELEKP